MEKANSHDLSRGVEAAIAQSVEALTLTRGLYFAKFEMSDWRWFALKHRVSILNGGRVLRRVRELNPQLLCNYFPTLKSPLHDINVSIGR